MARKVPAAALVAVCSLFWATMSSAIPTPKLVAANADGRPVVHALEDGSWLGLWSFAFSDHANAVTLANPGQLLAGFSGGTVLGFYDPALAAFAFPQTFERGRHDGALWVRWDSEPGQMLTYSWEYVNRGGVTRRGSDAMTASATQPGNPLATAIAEPSALALLALGLLVLATVRPRPRHPTTIVDSI